MSAKKEDLFGLENDSEEENNVSFDEEEEDSRFSRANLQKNTLNDSDEEESDAADDSDVEEPEEIEDHYEEKDEEEKNDDDEQELENKPHEDDKKADDFEDDEGYDAPEDLSEFGAQSKTKSKSKKKIKKLTPEELKKFEKAIKKTGVCYLSRIPPFMQPRQLRSILSKYTEIGRIYLVPEDPKTTARRKKYTRNRRTNFIEGWVEFKDKKTAKALAEHLNMKQIGGKRKSVYYHEIWNIKYLPKFKWHHLTEQMAHERQARQKRLLTEIAQANRENKVYIQNVQRAKKMQQKQEKKRQLEDNPDEEVPIKRTFKQRDKVEREVDLNESGKKALDKINDNHLKNVLGNIFSKK
ncbi:uncharacterized protein BX663DRAFT_434489 [Cokeromyces recurvatus]|uniref:uncharacterized protein n=1 Tax=Cokeromyces recurvatus TaxID=90255 RepID=UPI00221F11C4|nr:uncharacterized protein BX663DRAFT_434489 [Cokeromyces recurvatus]KAI7902924.1 hypothetical protein BX663DRAFT_434489 [Cokeromyces recurvatus]